MATHVPLSRRLLSLLAMLAVPAAPTVAAQPAMADGPDIREQIACGPISLPMPPVAGMQVIGGYAHGRMMFAQGDALIVNAGMADGVRPGQQYFVRRRVRDNFTPTTIDFTPISIHTAGWITIVQASERSAVATVTHSCDSMMNGDYLEPFVAPPVPDAPALPAAADFGHPAHIVMADERRQTGYEGLLMLIDRGSDHGVRAGQAVTIYRESSTGPGPIVDVGRATVLNVRPQTALVRIDSSRDAVYVGDFAAIHRITQ